ncbi:hypothetical protein ISS42_02655, partial [Candidatus Shapirobacteria bacterium]|nr:hypothetical protein [Candidatus Shapirobacteria bacterium]
GKKTGTANFSLELADFAGIAADGSPLDNEVIRPGDLRGSYTIIDESSDYCEDRGGKCVITYECLNLVPGGECRSGPIGCDSSSCCCFGDFAQTCTPPDYRCSSGEFQECTHGVSWWHNHPSGADCIIAQCTERNFRCFQNREQECDTGSLGSFWRDTGNACEGPTATPTKVLPAQCSVGGATGYCEYLTEPCLDDYTGYSGDVVCDSAGGRCCIQDVPPETPSLTFKIKFDEVDEQIPDQRVILTVKKRGIAKKVTDVVVTSDENGILTGEVDLLGIVPGAGYYFIIKGPKHVAERFCLAGQDVHCPAEQTLTLRMENVFDFSGWPLRPGDITGEEGVQDGKIDSLDWSFLADALISDDEAVRKQANLNYDLLPDGGQIIAGDDIRLFVKTMGTRYDDDY